MELEGVALGPKGTLCYAKNPHEGETSRGRNEVELEGVEPSSKQGNHTLSTRLFQTLVFEQQQDLDHQLMP